MQKIDLPYFEPLVLFLKQYEPLKALFGDKDFFAEPNIDFDDLNKHIKKGNRNLKYIWVYPAASRAKSNNIQHGCFPIQEHDFYIVLIGQCPRNKFAWTTTDGTNIELKGSVIDMLEIRNTIKLALQDFEKEYRNKPVKFKNLRWSSDDMPDYTSDENCGTLRVVSQYKVDIFN